MRVEAGGHSRDPTLATEGLAIRVTDNDELQRLADAYEAKRIEPAKALAFAKQPHAHTTYRFSDR